MCLEEAAGDRNLTLWCEETSEGDESEHQINVVTCRLCEKRKRFVPMFVLNTFPGSKIQFKISVLSYALMMVSFCRCCTINM